MPTSAYLAALAAITLLSRLPQLVSPNLLVDGDESIFGLMAKHLAEGREFPVFFYGQNYGLSIVEAPVAALAFLVAGVGPHSLKVAMLALWTVGVSFYFLAFSRPLGKAWSFWITLALVLMPAWAVTSMKGWSGYLTAFSATGLAFYLLTNDAKLGSARWVLLGVLTSIIYYSQPTWLPGLLPILLFFLVRSRGTSGWLLYLSGMAVVIVSIAAIKTWWLVGDVESWIRPSAGNPNLLGSIPGLLQQIYVNLTGSWFLASTVPSGPITSAVADVWLGLLAATSVLQIYRLVTRRYLLWSHLLASAVWATILATWVLLDARDARYLLAMDAPLVLAAGVELFDAARRYRLPDRRWLAAVGVVLVVEAAAMNEFSRFTYMWWKNDRGSPSEAKSMEKVIGYMRSRGAAHAFSMNALLQWQIMFYSRERVTARWIANVDRYPAYIREVDRALEAGEPVAIVGYTGFTGGLERMVPNPREIAEIDGKYFVYMRPDKALLRSLRFRFAN